MKTSMLFTITFITILLLTACSDGSTASTPTTYYVDAQNGDDTHSGSIEQPFKTVDKVNQLHLNPGDRVLFMRGTYYRGALYPVSGSILGDVYYGAYGEGEMPIFTCAFNAAKSTDWVSVSEHIYQYKDTIPYDVGNMILNASENFTVYDESMFGIKKWTMTDLKTTGDYFYDMNHQLLYIFCEIAPADRFDNIECCVNANIIDQQNCAYVTYENLHLTFGSAHGIGGGNTNHITIRGLEISYIGGSYLHDMDGEPVRYGNAVEFWGNATDHLVEDCLIYEVMDTGVTNQNNGSKANQERIIYRNNTIYNCGMASFEIDNGPSSGNLEAIYFTGNTCSHVGAGWGMTQDRYSDSTKNQGLSHHITSFFIETPTTNIHIENNVFTGYTHPDGLGAFFLLNNVAMDSHKGIIIKNNTYLDAGEYFAIIVNDGEITFMDEDDFDTKYNH